MTLGRDDGGEATVISQLLIIGITAGIVFVAASYAYFAVNSAIEEADHSAARLSLRGVMDRLDALDQEGVGASSVIDLPHQGELGFSGYTPRGASQDRLVIAAATGGITFDGLDDGDAFFGVCNTAAQIRVTWLWHNSDGSDLVRFPTPDCASTQADDPIEGLVSIEVIDGGEVIAAAIVADLPLMTVTTGTGETEESSALVGNTVLGGPDQVTAQRHVQGTDALAIRLWALEGDSFAVHGDRDRFHVRVTDQAWLAQLDGLDDITIQVQGPHWQGLRDLYQEHGGMVTDEEPSADTATLHFDASHLDVHAAHMQGALLR